jgi:CMP-N-acetylneuraminic acid synthetase
VNKIAVVSFGRKKSERCPNKMLRPFVGTTLTDIVLSKIRFFGIDSYFAGFEPEFKEKCAKYGVNFIQRTERSVNIDGPILDVFGFVNEVKCKKILFINPCVPFLSLDTIRKFLDHCLSHYDNSALAVVKRNNYFFDDKKKALNFVPASDSWNTKTVKLLFESANVLYYFDKDYFLNKGFYWDWSTVDLVDFERTQEFIDIDTEDDFKLAEDIYKLKERKDWYVNYC